MPSAYYCFSIRTRTRAGRAVRAAARKSSSTSTQPPPNTVFTWNISGFGVAVVSTTPDPSTNQWLLQTSTGEQYPADVLVPAVGQLSPSLLFPSIPGLRSFGGQSHSAEWDDDVELAGKRIAVIGTGAECDSTGTEEIAPIVASLTVFQRSAAHIVTASRLPAHPPPSHAGIASSRRASCARLTWQMLTEEFPWVLQYSPALSRGAMRLSRAFMRLQTRGKPACSTRSGPIIQWAVSGCCSRTPTFPRCAATMSSS